MEYWKEHINYRQENGRYLITVDGKDMEAEQDICQVYTKMERRERYLIEREAGICISLDALQNGWEHLIQPEESAEDAFIVYEEEKKSNVLKQRLMSVLHCLSIEEQELINASYFQGMSIREYTRETGVTLRAIQKRRDRILKKIKNLLSDFINQG